MDIWGRNMSSKNGGKVLYTPFIRKEISWNA
jgi:hypothetical protein